MNHRLALSASLVGFAVLTSIGAFAYFIDKDSSDGPKTAPYVTDFASCARAGYPIQESYPRRCSAPDGRSFTEIVAIPPIDQSGQKLQTLSRGTFGFEKASQQVITNEKEFAQLWKRLRQNSTQVSKQPQVDFNNQVVLAVFGGTRPTGGDSIEIRDISWQQDQDMYRVEVVETSPGPKCASTAAVTSPYHIVSYFVPGISTPTAKNVEFVSKTKLTDCAD